MKSPTKKPVKLRLKKIHKNRIAALAHHLLSHAKGRNRIRIDTPGETGKDVVKFDMDDYNDGRIDAWVNPPVSIADCGTSCCLAGYSTLVFPELLNKPDWDEVAHWLTGSRGASVFLFASDWESDILLAAARVLYLLEDVHEHIDEVFYGVYSYPPDLKASPALEAIYRRGKKQILEDLTNHLRLAV